MQLRSELQLATMMRAMQQVVIPAIDPKNQLAMEQAQLITGMMALMAQQLPVQFQFDRDELQRLLDSSQRLLVLGGSNGDVTETVGILAKASQRAAQVLQLCTVDPARLTDAVHSLREAIGNVMTAVAAQADQALLVAVESEILELSKQQLLRDRALLALQGWEPDAKTLPTIGELLGG
jgi:hypothetical protein